MRGDHSLCNSDFSGLVCSTETKSIETFKIVRKAQ